MLVEIMMVSGCRGNEIREDEEEEKKEEEKKRKTRRRE